MDNHWLLHMYVRQRQRALVREAKEARLLREAASAPQQEKPEQPALRAWLGKWVGEGHSLINAQKEAAHR